MKRIKQIVLMIIFYGFSSNLLSYEHEQSPVAVDYLCIDFKYNPTDGIKICEIQLAKKSGGTKGIDLQMDQEGYVARLFFEILQQHFPKVCMISNSMYKSYEEEAQQSGVILYQSLEDFFQYAQAQKSFVSPPSDPLSASSYGCLLLTSIPELKIAEETIRKQFPGIVLMDKDFYRSCLQETTTGNNKGKVDQILKSHKALKTMRPKSQVYLAQDDPLLYQNILKQIGGDTFVIKPLIESNGNGVLIIKKHQLKETLKNIITKQMPKHIENNKKNDKMTYSKYFFWENTQQEKLLVEQFIPSNTFISPIDNKPYDPTIRLFALLIHYEDHTKAIILGSLLKLPPRSLLNQASLITKHCSCSPPKNPFPLPLDTKEKIEPQFYKILPILHQIILRESQSLKDRKNVT